MVKKKNKGTSIKVLNPNFLPLYVCLFWSSTPKKLAKAPAEPNVTPRKSPRLISKAMNNLNSSSRKVVLDFGDDPKPTQPTQESGGDNLHVGGSQCIVDLQNDEEQAHFWTKASTKVTNLEEAFKAMQESVCNLDNWGEDECHPEDAPWTRPLLYSEGEDATEWSRVLRITLRKLVLWSFPQGGRSDYGVQEGNSEDDGYEQLLETDDEAEDKLKIDGPAIDLGPDFFTNVLEEDNGLEVVNGYPVDQSLEIPNGPREWFYDYEDIFGEDPLDNEELFPEDAGVEQVVEPGLVEVGTQFSDKLAFKRHLDDNLRIRAVCKFSGPPINCQWFMYARKLPNEPTFNIKGFCLEHTCIGDPLGRNSSANPEFVAQCVIENLAEIANDFWTSHNTLIPYHVAWKAVNISYKLVPSLCEMIRMTNPCSIAKFTYG
ncbi:hypothetical protein MKW92_001944, partial [Papaver armeniacum]